MPEIKERPILFSAPMVRAILEDRKTVTRRALNAQALKNIGYGVQLGECHELPSKGPLHPNSIGYYTDFCPYGQPGERLWVRETWSDVNLQGAPGIAYRADGDVRDLMEEASFLDEGGAFNYDDPRSKPYQFACWSEDLLGGKEGRWRPSIHIPRWASRILLEITDVRVERLQDIIEEQAKAEGVRLMRDGSDTWVSRESPGNLVTPWPTAKEAFRDLWESINGAGAWNANPWVWVVEFKHVTP